VSREEGRKQVVFDLNTVKMEKLVVTVEDITYIKPL
jgi:hypothetical protein